MRGLPNVCRSQGWASLNPVANNSPCFSPVKALMGWVSGARVLKLQKIWLSVKKYGRHSVLLALWEPWWGGGQAGVRFQQMLFFLSIPPPLPPLSAAIFMVSWGNCSSKKHHVGEQANFSVASGAKPSFALAQNCLMPSSAPT